MNVRDEIIKIYEKEEEILPYINKLREFSFDDLIKTTHFYYSVEEKNTDLELIKRKFKEYEKIKLIKKRKHKNSEISFDFYYELEDGTYILYAITFKERPILLNSFHVKRNFKHFKKSLIKAYRKQLTG